MEVALARQLQPHISGLDPGKLDLQRLLVAIAVEHDARVLKNLPPRPVVVGSEHEQMGVARGHCVAAIEHQHAIDRHRPAQVNPPPGIRFVGRMEPPTAILDAVTPAPGVLFRAYSFPAGLNRWGRLAQFLLSQPIGLELLGRDRRRRCLGSAAGEDQHSPKHNSERTIPFHGGLLSLSSCYFADGFNWKWCTFGIRAALISLSRSLICLSSSCSLPSAPPCSCTFRQR